jgi:hypothetical protein
VGATSTAVDRRAASLPALADWLLQDVLPVLDRCESFEGCFGDQTVVASGPASTRRAARKLPVANVG